MRRWISRIVFSLLAVLLVASFAVWLIEFYPRYGSRPPLRLAQGTLAIQHARIYTSPTAPPIEDGTLLIHDGRIVDVGAQVKIPADATLIPCNGCVVTAGFWNAHVHFTEPKWSLAQWKSAATLNPQLADMFLSRGFTTIVDLGSNPADTLAIRRRIEKGRLTGPYIYTAGTALYRYFNLDIPRPKLPHVEAWYDRLQQRAAYQAGAWKNVASGQRARNSLQASRGRSQVIVGMTRLLPSRPRSWQNGPTGASAGVEERVWQSGQRKNLTRGTDG